MKILIIPLTAFLISEAASEIEFNIDTFGKNMSDDLAPFLNKAIIAPECFRLDNRKSEKYKKRV